MCSLNMGFASSSTATASGMLFEPSAADRVVRARDARARRQAGIRDLQRDDDRGGRASRREPARTGAAQLGIRAWTAAQGGARGTWQNLVEMVAGSRGRERGRHRHRPCAVAADYDGARDGARHPSRSRGQRPLQPRRAGRDNAQLVERAVRSPASYSSSLPRLRRRGSASARAAGRRARRRGPWSTARPSSSPPRRRRSSRPVSSTRDRGGRPVRRGTITTPRSSASWRSPPTPQKVQAQPSCSSRSGTSTTSAGSTAARCSRSPTRPSRSRRTRPRCGTGRGDDRRGSSSCGPRRAASGSWPRPSASSACAGGPAIRMAIHLRGGPRRPRDG